MENKKCLKPPTTKYIHHQAPRSPLEMPTSSVRHEQSQHALVDGGPVLTGLVFTARHRIVILRVPEQSGHCRQCPKGF